MEGASPCLTPLASLVGAELARPLCFVSRHPFRRVLLGKAIVFGESLAAVEATLENHNLLPEPKRLHELARLASALAHAIQAPLHVADVVRAAVCVEDSITAMPLVEQLLIEPLCKKRNAHTDT